MSADSPVSIPSADAPHAGFPSAERQAAAKAFLKAHSSYGFLGSFLRECQPVASAEVGHVHVITQGKSAFLVIPQALEPLTDEPIGAANALSAAIVDEAGRHLIRAMTRTRPAPKASKAAADSGQGGAISAAELEGALKKEGLDDIASKLFDRRAHGASPAAPSPQGPSA